MLPGDCSRVGELLEELLSDLNQILSLVADWVL